MSDNSHIKISELDRTETVSGSDFIETSVPAPIGAETPYESKKLSLSRLNNWSCNINEHYDLETENKTIVKAINEVKNNGGKAYDGAAVHNSIYRGKWLGVSPTQEQYKNINNGTFEDIFIGDFWSEDPDDPAKTRWRVAGFNYYDTEENHAVIIPDTYIVEPKDSPGLDASAVADSYGSFGGYLYSPLRGYQSEVETIILTENGQTSFTVQHTPIVNYGFVISTNVLIEFSNGDYRPIAFAWKIKSVTGNTIEIDENSFTVIGQQAPFPLELLNEIVYEPEKFLPAEKGVIVVYKTLYENRPVGLVLAKSIIEEKFGTEHLLTHKSLIPGFDDYNFQFSNSVLINTTVEAPTVEMIIGSNCNNKTENMLLRGWTEPQWVNKTPDGFKADFNTNKTEDLISNLSVENTQLPLFRYDPSLIHTRAGYWFRDIQCMAESNPPGHTRMYGWGVQKSIGFWKYEQSYMDPNGYVNWAKGQQLQIGTRPVFCIY